jgi:hypothetical protein
MHFRSNVACTICSRRRGASIRPFCANINRYFEEWRPAADWECCPGRLIVGLRQVGAGRDYNVVMRGLVVLNWWCLAVALDGQFAYLSDYIKRLYKYFCHGLICLGQF